MLQIAFTRSFNLNFPKNVRIDEKYINRGILLNMALNLHPFVLRVHIYYVNWRDQSRAGVDLRHALYHFGITKQGGERGGGTRLLHPSS